MSVAVLAAVTAGGAFAEGEQDALVVPRDAPPLTEEMQREMEEGQRLAAEFEARRRDPVARRERERTREAYRGLDRGGALALAREKLGSVFGHPAFVQAMPAGEVERFIGDFGALVHGPVGPVLVEAGGAPLSSRVGSETRELVDLRLDERDGAFVPRNPAVPLRIARSGEVALGASDMRAWLAGMAATEQPVAVDGRVFFADALRDTDLVVIPRPAGVAFAFQVRSAAAPEEGELRFELPVGARLRPAPDGIEAGVEIVEGEDVIARVLPPAAWDSDGVAVDTSYELRGDSLVVRFRHVGLDLNYPLYVDPDIFEDFGANGILNKGFAEWGSYANAGLWDFSPLTASEPWGWVRNKVGSFGGSEWARIFWEARRGYIHYLGGNFGHSYAVATKTCSRIGILANSWLAWKAYSNSCSDFSNKTVQLGNTDTSYKDYATLNLSMNGTSMYRSYQSTVATDGVRLGLKDVENPTVVSVSNSTNGSWVRGATTVTVTTKARDAGLGLARMNVDYGGSVLATRYAKPDGTTSTLSSDRCTGIRPKRCPIGDVTGGLAFSTDNLKTSTGAFATGSLTLGGKAIDALDKTTSYTTSVKVDRASPTNGVSGPLLTAAEKVVAGPTALALRPQDSHSGVKSVAVYVDRATQPAPAYSWSHSTCSVSVQCPTAPAPPDYTFDPGTFADGKHAVEVEVKDALSHTSPPSKWNVLADSTPPSVPALSHDAQPAATSWWNGTASVSATASDRGTAPAGEWGSGIERIELLDGDEVVATKSYACTDTIAGRCREGESHEFAYSAAGEPPAGAVQLAEGVRTLSVRAVDKAGRVSGRSESWEVRVARGGPTLTLTGSLPGLEGRAASGGVTDLHVHADSPAGVRTLELSLDGDPLGGPAPREPVPGEDCEVGGCDLAHALELNLDDVVGGDHELTVRAVDGIGNVRTRVLGFAVDREGPDIMLSGSLAGWWVHEQPQQLAVDAADASGVQALTLEVDGAPVDSASFDCTSPAECGEIMHQFELVPAGYSAGAHTLRLVATDSLGNRSEQEWSVWFSLDGRPFNTESPRVVGRAQYGETLSATVGEWHSSTPATPAYRWQRCDDAEAVCDDIFGATGSTYTLGEDDLGKRVRVTVAMTNSAGTDTAASRGRLVPVENVPEVSLELSSPAWFAGWVGLQPLEATVTASDPGVEGGSGIDAVSLTLDGQPVTPEAPCELQEGVGACERETTFPLDLRAFTEGVHTLEATTTDTAGTTASVTRVVQLDRTVPELGLNGSLVDAAGNVPPGSYQLDIAAADLSASSPQSGVTRVDVLVDGELATRYEQPCELGGCSLSRSFTFDTSRWGPGRHRVEVVASDHVDNQTRAGIDLHTGCQASVPARTGSAETVTAAEAEQTLTDSHPKVVAPSEPVTVDDETYRPTLVDHGGVLSAADSGARAEIPADPAGSVVLGSGVTTACLTPTEVGQDATAAATVNGDSALSANTGPASDTVIRPVVEGVETFTSIRSEAAPESFSWELAAGDAQLEAGEGGSVALVDGTPPRFDLAGETVAVDTLLQLEDAQAAGEVVADAQLADPAAQEEAEQAVGESGLVDGASDDDVADADAASDPVEPPGDEDDPGDDPGVSLDEATAGAAEQLSDELQTEAQASLVQSIADGATVAAALNEQAEARADAELEPLVLAEVAEPVSHDANGADVPTSLSVDGNTLTLNVDHRPEPLEDGQVRTSSTTAYPIAADPWFTEARTEKRTGYRPVYKTETRVVDWRKQWRYLSHGAAAHWISTLPSKRRSDGLYEVYWAGKTYRMAKKTWAPIDILVKTPIYGKVKVFSHWQAYTYWVNVTADVWRDDDDRGLASAARAVTSRHGDLVAEMRFNRPKSSTAEDPTVFNHLIELIDNTPRRTAQTGACPDANIRATVHSINAPRVITALEDAINECVHVKILQNGAQDPLPPDLRRAIDSPDGTNSTHRYCPKGRPDPPADSLPGQPKGACVSTHLKGVMHAKYMLFGKTAYIPAGKTTRTEADRVVWFGSANMTTGENARFNNTMTISKAPTFYAKVRDRIWEPMWARRPFKYGAGEGAFSLTHHPRTTVEPSPIPAGSLDPIVRELRRIKQKGCEIRMMHALWEARSPVYKELAEKGAGANGCAVLAFAGTKGFSDSAKTHLKTVDPKRRRLFALDKVHDKVLIAEWQEGGETRRLVLTGSQNMTLPARDIHDELLVGISDSKTIYDNYRSHFRKMRERDDKKCVLNTPGCG